MRKLTSFIFVFFLLFYGCKQSTEPQPPEQKPAGYQENITWPSLSDSPWPMEHHDPQYTGRSTFNGPASFNVVKLIDTLKLDAGISVGKDSFIYMPFNFFLFSLNLAGQIKFSKSFGIYTLTTPIVKKNGDIVIYYESPSAITEINKAGEIIWQYNLDFNLSTQLGIDREGNIYFTHEGTLYVLDNSGHLSWSLEDNRFGTVSSFSFSPDGKMLYLAPNKGLTILALDLTQKEVKWTFGESGNIAYPALIDADGNIYFSSEGDENNSPGFYSLNPEGKINWHFAHNMFYRHYAIHSPPTMDKYGNIYFAKDTLYSFDINGKLRWKKYIGNVSTPTPLVCDAGNNIYVTIGVIGNWGIVKLDKDGNILFSTPANAFKGETSVYSPVILDKMILMPTQDKYVYLIK